MNKTMKKIRKIISDIVFIVLAVIIILLVGIKIVGFTPYAVLSGSMQPELNIGDLVYVKECNEITIGDYITFYINNGKNIVTHQVIEIDHNNGYITKGIANETADISPVQVNDVIGRVYFSIPYMGYVSKAVTTSPIKYYIIAVVILCLSVKLLLVYIHK